MHIFTRPHVRTGVRTSVIAALALAVGVLATLAFTPHRAEGVPPPASVYQASVGGTCSTVVRGFNPDDVWAAPLHGGQLVRVDPAAVGVTGCRVDPDPNRH